eukprot:scaffold34451_cov101-Isochrysis_galbana.AAC.2
MGACATGLPVPLLTAARASVPWQVFTARSFKMDVWPSYSRARNRPSVKSVGGRRFGRGEMKRGRRALEIEDSDGYFGSYGTGWPDVFRTARPHLADCPAAARRPG